MKLRMVSWNVRDLNDLRKRLVVRNLLREWNCDVVCLQETKLAGMLWSWHYVDWVALDADQTAGGVLMMWEGLGDGFIWACSGFYGPNDNILRGQMWDELIGIQQLWEVPWCFIGDFNIVRFPSERFGGSRLTSAMENFSEFIEELSLIDLSLEGGSYTWSSGSDQPNIKKQSFTHVHSP